MTHRWLKFWPQDWQSDAALRLCSLTARGMWMEMICLMHAGTPYGHLTIGEMAISTRQLGMVTGVGEKEATKLMAELEDAGVFSRTPAGIIFSRRMVRDKHASDVSSAAGKKGGGNPHLREPLNPTFKGNGKGHPKGGLNSRVQKQEAESEAESDSERESCAGDARDAPSLSGRIFSDWWPDADGLDCAKASGMRTAEQVADGIGQFIDVYTAKGTALNDWQAQWRVWCRRRNGA